MRDRLRAPQEELLLRAASPANWGEWGEPRGLVPSRAGSDANREGGAGGPRDQATFDGMGVSSSHRKAQVHLHPDTEASQDSRARVYCNRPGEAADARWPGDGGPALRPPSDPREDTQLS